MATSTVSVGINGFGAVGRNVFYAALHDPSVSVVAINDASFSAACIAYMIERESPAHLPRVHAEQAAEGIVAVNGTHRIIVTQETRPSKWTELGARVVLECTGTTTTRDRCSMHLTFGAEHVVVAAHSADAPLAVPAVRSIAVTDVQGRAVRVHSCGSRIGALLGPLLHRLNAALSLEEVSYTVVSGLSDEADAAAGRCADPLEWRQLRLQQSMATGKGAFAPSVARTGVPTLKRLLPGLEDRISATAFQVPGHKGCAIDLFVRTATAATKAELDAAVAAAPSGDPPVEGGAATAVVVAAAPKGGAMISTDCLGCPYLVYEKDVSATLGGGRSHRLVLWVDLEWAYAKQVVALAKMLPTDVSAKLKSVDSN